jgi:hypothetical protein
MLCSLTASIVVPGTSSWCDWIALSNGDIIGWDPTSSLSVFYVCRFEERRTRRRPPLKSIHGV